jgi:Lamin Tail Domain
MDSIMLKRNLVRVLLSAGAVAIAAVSAHADPLPDVRITEFMYKQSQSPGEFVQFTNLGSTAVNLSGWSEDDDNDTAGVHPLSGILQPGQSAILTEATPAAFDAAWGLPASTDVIQEDGNDNLGSSDTIFLFDGSSVVDELTYGTTGPKASGTAAVPKNAAAIGANNSANWVLLVAGQNGAIHATGFGSPGDVASPGFSSFAPVPLPAAAWLFVGGLGLFVPALRRRKA